jgi:hypothetical protein
MTHASHYHILGFHFPEKYGQRVKKKQVVLLQLSFCSDLALTLAGASQLRKFNRLLRSEFTILHTRSPHGTKRSMFAHGFNYGGTN